MKNENKNNSIRKEMTNYLGHNRNYVLLLVVVVAIIVLVLWALFRKDDDCKNGDSSDSYSDSRYSSASDSRDSRYTKDSHSRDCDKYSSDSYSESYSHDDEKH